MRITEGQLRRIIREELDSGDDTIDRMMELDPWTFDQDAELGWRSLPAEDQVEALRAYIEGPAPGMKKKHPGGKLLNRSTMTWHLGQALAMKGRAEEATRWMGQSLVKDDPQWNSYVRATIAFLMGDRPEFEEQGGGENYNSSTLDRLRAGWGRPYREVY